MNRPDPPEGLRVQPGRARPGIPAEGPVLHYRKKADITFTPRPPPVYQKHYPTIVYVSGAGKRKDGITHEIVRFLAWLKNRGAQQRLIYCRKKWDGKGIDIREVGRGPA